jgi:hypothetical protein
VKDLNREVFAFLSEHLARLFLHDSACPVVRIHHLVADLVQRRASPVVVAFRSDAGGSCFRRRAPQG